MLKLIWSELDNGIYLSALPYLTDVPMLTVALEASCYIENGIINRCSSYPGEDSIPRDEVHFIESIFSSLNRLIWIYHLDRL